MFFVKKNEIRLFSDNWTYMLSWVVLKKYYRTIDLIFIVVRLFFINTRGYVNSDINLRWL